MSGRFVEHGRAEIPRDERMLFMVLSYEESSVILARPSQATLHTSDAFERLSHVDKGRVLDLWAAALDDLRRELGPAVVTRFLR